jgi:lipopolysaccharide/colanic/teichoic acid biosynthesis glycosyltransferase
VIFFIVAMLIIRTFDKNIDDIYISFDKDLCSKNSNFIYCDYKDFPSNILDTLTELLKSSNLRGLIFNQSESEDLSFHEIVEISNYFGINIYEIINDKYKLVHKSTSLSTVLKNFEDVFLLTLVLPLFLFIMAPLSLVILIFQGRPIFYTQDRVGLNGRYFKIIKFRSMNDNVISEDELKKLNKKSKIVFKATKDPRITKIGSFLRKSSLDELPQIINVLKNEMSFVGPRPPIITEVKQYELKHLKRISVKPGITGLWQVTLRQDNNFDRWVKKDIEYIENWSIALDFKILFKTFNEIIGMTGE